MVKVMGKTVTPRSAVGLAMVILGSVGINILLMLTTALVWPFNTALARRLVSKWQALWMDLVSYALPRSTLHVSGELPTVEDLLPYDKKKMHLMISNHMVDADWYFLWMVCVGWNAPSSLQLVLVGLGDTRLLCAYAGFAVSTAAAASCF